MSHLTAKIKKLKERVEAAGPPAAAPSCGCAGLCKGLGEGLEGLKKEVRNLEVEAERREMDAERKENESLRRLGELRGEMRDGKADAQFAVLERRVEELEQELGCRTEAELALQRNGEAVAELRKRIDGTEAELASQRNGEAIAELRKRINKMELAQPAEKAIDELKRSQRKSEGELSRLQAEFRSEAAEAGKRNDRNVRAELAKARQEILEEVAGTVEKERESVSRTIADRTADLAESVRRIDGAEADSIKRVEAVEDAHTKLAANVKQQLAEFRDGNGTGKEVEKLRESVEALQSVSDETTERLAEAEEGMEGAKAAATAGLEGLGARIKGLEERVTASIADAQKERKEGTARTGVLQEGLEGLREAVAGLDAAAAAAEPERRKNSERLDGFQKDLEGLQRTVQRLGNSTSAVGETETALGVKALRAELDGVRASVSKIEGAAVDVNALRAELDGVKASVSGFENVAEAVNALRADLDCVNASVSRLEESLSKVEENAGLRSETLSKELSKVRETVAALDAFASEAAAKATLERGESVEARKLLEKRLEELTERVVKCQAEWDGPKSEGVRSLPTDLDGLSDGVKALRADVAKASDGVELLRTDLGGVSDGVDCMRTELDVLKEVLLQLENKVNEAAAKKEVSRGSEAEGSLRDDVAALRGHVAALEASVQEARSAEVEAAGKKESLEEVATRLGYLEAAVEEMRARKSFGDVEGKLREESGRLEASVEALSANGKPETDGRIRESLEGLEARAAAAEAIGKSFASQASVDELRLRLEELEKLGADLQSMKAELDGLRGRHEEFEALRSDVARMEDAVKEAREKVAESGSAEKSDASTGQGLAEVRDRLKALEASLGDLRGREEENEGRLEGMQEQFGELAESVEDAQRKGVEQTEGLERRIAAMAEEGQGVKDSEEELESRVNELQDKVTQLGSSVEELTEQRNEGDSAERERRTDLRVKLIESEADGLKQAVEQLREQQTDSAGNLESVQKQVGDLVSQLSGVTRCPLHDSVEELRARNGDTEHSLEEIRLKLEGLEDDLRRQIGGGHVDQQVERLALAVGKLAETCARDHEALAAGICRHEVGQGAGSKTTSADEGARGKKSGASSIATAVDTERADSGALPDRESIDFAGSRNLVGVLLSGEDSDLEGSPTSPPDVTMTTSFGSPAAEDEPGGAPRAQSWDDIGAQLADVRQSLSGKVGSGSATGSEFSVAAAWATAQSEAGLNPLYELGSTSVEKGAVKEEELGTGASAAAAAPPPSLLMHENLLYQTPISPPSNVTSPADVTTKSSFNSFGGPDRLEPAVGGTGSNGASAPPSGNSVPPSGMPASGTHVPRRPPSLKLDALPGIVPSDLSLRPKSPLGRKSRTQAGFSDKDWSEPPRNAVEVPASLPFARDSLSYLTSPVSPGGGTPRGNRTEFRERRGWAGTEPEKAPSPVCPSPGLANEFLDPKELTPSPSPVDTGSRKPGEFQERTETSTGRSGREGRNRRGSPGSDQSRDSLEGENDVSVLPGEVSGGPPSPGGQSPTAGLSSQGQSKGGRGDESGTRNIDRDFDRAVTSASSAGDVTEKAHAVHGSSARQSPRTESAGRYGPGEDPGEASDSQSDVSEHEVDVGEDEIPEEMDEWDLGVEGLEDVLGSD